MGYFLLTLSRSKFQSPVAGRLLVTGFIALGFRLILLFCFLVMEFDPQARRRALGRQRNLKVVQQLFKPSLSWYIYIPIYSKQTSLSDFNIFHVFLIPSVIWIILYPFFCFLSPQKSHFLQSPVSSSNHFTNRPRDPKLSHPLHRQDQDPETGRLLSDRIQYWRLRQKLGLGWTQQPRMD